jgi:hypothetical protein
MTTSEYSPLLRDGSSRTSTTQHHLPINAHYYDITDIQSWPIAGLLVLLDGQSQPVRAELHMDSSLDEQMQDAAIRQARLVLQERYLGGEPVPVRILDSMPVREEMLVRLPPVGARSLNMQSFAWHWRPHGMIGAAILLVVALIWIAVALFGGDGEPESNTATVVTPDVASQSAAGQSAGEEAPEEGGAVVEEESAPPAEASAEDTPVAPAVVSDLPPSRNARSDLGIGVEVQVVPGLRLALRSEAGAEAGVVVGDMGEGETAVIIGGPQYTRGDSDTIVWWFVELADGTQAWAAANTSEQTLLRPVE